MLYFEIINLYRQRALYMQNIACYLLVLIIFPMLLPVEDLILLPKLASPIVWFITSIIFIFNINNFFSAAQKSFLSHYILASQSLYRLIIHKIISQWLFCALPLLLCLPLLIPLYNITFEHVIVLILVLAMATIIFSIIDCLMAIIFLHITTNNMLAIFIVFPFYLPIIIFGVGVHNYVDLVSANTFMLNAILFIQLPFCVLFGKIILKSQYNLKNIHNI